MFTLTQEGGKIIMTYTQKLLHAEAARLYPEHDAAIQTRKVNTDQVSKRCASNQPDAEQGCGLQKPAGEPAAEPTAESGNPNKPDELEQRHTTRLSLKPMLHDSDLLNSTSEMIDHCSTKAYGECATSVLSLPCAAFPRC